MMNAVVIDDDTFALKIIENYCGKVDFIKLEKSFSEPKKGLKYLNKFPIDLLFLDIDMPFINGIELYKQLRQDTMVIFITSKPDYAIEGFNLMAVDYLLKPFTFERFMQAVKRANEFYNFNIQSEKSEDSKFLFIRADFSLIKIAIDDIIYVEALDDYVKIYRQDEKTIVARMTMKNMLEKLPADKFIRVHRSFIVAINRIKALRSKTVLVDRLEIPFGGNYVQEVSSRFKHL